MLIWRLNKHINVIYARNLNANLMIKTGNVIYLDKDLKFCQEIIILIRILILSVTKKGGTSIYLKHKKELQLLCLYFTY